MTSSTVALFGGSHREISAAVVFAANRTYALAGRVEDVAEQLGLSSLDAAAHFVDHQWQDRWGDLIRASSGSR